VFQRGDLNHDNYITADEILATEGTEEDIVIMHEIDVNDDNKLSREEVYNFFKENPFGLASKQRKSGVVSKLFD
jgi:EF hand